MVLASSPVSRGGSRGGISTPIGLPLASTPGSLIGSVSFRGGGDMPSCVPKAMLTTNLATDSEDTSEHE